MAKQNLQSDVGKFDFECDEDTKYIVAGLGHCNGMGIFIKYVSFFLEILFSL